MPSICRCRSRLARKKSTAAKTGTPIEYGSTPPGLRLVYGVTVRWMAELVIGWLVVSGLLGAGRTTIYTR
jgi:hypothetical protein